MNQTFSLLFYLKKPKDYKEGLVTIYARITVEGKRAELTTGVKCDPTKWNSKGGKPLGYSEEAKSLTKYLDTIKNRIYDGYNRLLITNGSITAENIKNAYFGKLDVPELEKVIGILEVFKDHNKKVEALLGKEFAPGTLERYKTSLKHTKDFIYWKYKLDDYDIKKINHGFVTEYEFYLRSERNCTNNTTIKYIKNFGKIIRICIANGWIDKTHFPILKLS